MYQNDLNYNASDYSLTPYSDTVNATSALADKLESLNKFLIQLVKSETVLCANPNARYRAELTEWYKKGLLQLPGYIDVVEVLPKRYTYAPYLNVFIECCEAMQLCGRGIEWRTALQAPEQRFDCLNDMSAAQVFARLVTSVWLQCRSPAVCSAMYRLKYEANKRYDNYCQYVDALWLQSSRLIVVRLDPSVSR